VTICYELPSIEEEVVMASVKLLPWYSSGSTKENHKELSQITSCIQLRCNSTEPICSVTCILSCTLCTYG